MKQALNNLESDADNRTKHQSVRVKRILHSRVIRTPGRAIGESVYVGQWSLHQIKTEQR